MFFVPPIISQVVIHFHRIPNDVSQESNRVLVHRLGIRNLHYLQGEINIPAARINNLTGGTVNNFPVFLRICVLVSLQLFAIETLHIGNRN